MSLERKTLLKAIYDEMYRAVDERVRRILIGDRLNLAAPTIGVLPPTAGGTGTPAGVTIRGATDYDNTTTPMTGQGILWNGTKYHPATLPTGITTLAGLSDVTISSPQDGDYLTYVAADGKWHNRRPGLVVTLNGQDVTLGGRDLTLGV